MYKKAVSTAEAGGRGGMVMQEAPREGEQKSCRAYQNLSNTEVAVDAVLFFPARHSGTALASCRSGCGEALCRRKCCASSTPRTGRVRRGATGGARSSSLVLCTAG